MGRAIKSGGGWTPHGKILVALWRTHGVLKSMRMDELGGWHGSRGERAVVLVETKPSPLQMSLFLIFLAPKGHCFPPITFSSMYNLSSSFLFFHKIYLLCVSK